MSDMEKKLTFRLLGDSSGLKNSMKEVDGASNGLSGTMKKLGGIIATTFAVGAVVSFGKKIVETTADIQAMESQFDQVFKEDNSKAVEMIGKQVEELGIHSDRLTGSWSKFGGQVKGAGMDAEQSLEAVNKAVRLSADASAFYDKSMEESSQMLASFMKGNFEAGDSIGVFTNAKQMDVKANEQYGKSWANLSEAERQWLLLDTVEKTYELNGAMGQAQRESEAYMNVMGNLNATFDRFLATIGTPILTVFLMGVQKLIEFIELLQVKLTSSTEAFQPMFNSLKTFFTEVKDKVVEIVNTIVTTVQEWYERNKESIELLVERFTFFATAVGETIMLVLDLIKMFIDMFTTYFLDYALAVINRFTGVFTGIVLVVQGVIKIIKGIFTGDWALIWEGAQTIFEGVWKAIVGGFEGVVGEIKAIVNVIIGLINKMIGAWNSIEFKIPKISLPFGESFGGFSIGVPKIPKIPLLADGGIITAPTLAMVGEGGESEAVIPLSKLESMVGGGANGLVVNVYGSVGVDDIGEQIVNTLRRKGVMSFA